MLNTPQRYPTQYVASGSFATELSQNNLCDFNPARQQCRHRHTQDQGAGAFMSSIRPQIIAYGASVHSVAGRDVRRRYSEFEAMVAPERHLR